MTDNTTPATEVSGSTIPDAAPENTTARTTTALVFAAGVAAVMLVGALASGISYGFQDLIGRVVNGFMDGGFFTDAASAAQWIGTAAGQALLNAIAVGAGVFLSLRFFRPIAADTPLRTVIIRGLIATLAATITATIIIFVASGLSGASVRGSLFANSFPAVDLFSQTIENFFWSLAGIPDRVVSLATTILLVTVLGWLWLRRTPLK